MKSLLSQAKPFTAVRLGALTLLTDLLEQQGHQRAADDIYRASGPLLGELGVVGLRGARDALAAMSGRPPAKVSAALVNDDLARMVSAGLRRLAGDGPDADTLTAYADVFATDPSAMVLAGIERAPAALERQMATMLRELWRRADEIDTARRTAGETDAHLFTTMQDSRVLNAAVRLVDPPARRGSTLVIPEMASVVRSRRYGNRVAAAMAMVAAGRVYRAVDSSGWERALEGCAMFAAIAETVRATGPTQRRAVVAEPGTPVGRTPWRPMQWLSTLMAWSGAGTEDVREVTVWRLSTVEANVLVLAAGWAMSMIGACSTLQSRVDADGVREHLEIAADFDWAGSAHRGWDLLQSTRRAPDRSPWPTRMSWSSWTLGDTAGLPWSVTAGEDEDDDDGDAPAEPVLERDVVDEPAFDVRVRVVGGRMDGVQVGHDAGSVGDGPWVLVGDDDRIGSSWSELLESVTASGGRMVLA